MRKLFHKTLVIGLATLAIGLVLLWLCYPFSRSTPDYRQSNHGERREQVPAKVDRHKVTVSNENLHLPQERSLAGIDIGIIDIDDDDIEEFGKALRYEMYAERKRRLAAEVSKETIPEKVKNLLCNASAVSGYLLEHDFASGNRYILTLQDDPRVKSLVELATHGSESERQELLENLTKMCHVYLDELPLLSTGGPWQPTALSAGGGDALPYLLTYVDEDATTLDLLARMYLRHQKATKEVHKVDTDDWFKSKVGLVFAYACDHFLEILRTRAELQEELSAKQLQVLKEYADHRRGRAKHWNIELRQCVVMEFAVRFCKAGREASGAEMQ